MIIIDTEGVNDETIPLAIMALHEVRATCISKGDTYGITIFGSEEHDEPMVYVGAAFRLDNNNNS